MHTYSNFLMCKEGMWAADAPDPYVSPVPHEHLACIGAAEIPVAEPTFFRQTTQLDTVKIEDELITYDRVSDDASWTLLGCERGAWGTRPAADDA